VRQGIFNRGNISDSQQLINPFSFFGKKHPFQYQKTPFHTKKPAPLPYFWRITYPPAQSTRNSTANQEYEVKEMD
jgi:hypothetical protein